jgi:hypothetical protein
MDLFTELGNSLKPKVRPDYEEIILDELNQWVYNEQNQAGEKLQVIDASDLPLIVKNIVEKINKQAKN